MEIATDEIASFGVLLQARPGVFETTRSFDGFTRKVEALGTDGEEGRRRGLGLWMLGRYDEAAAALQSYSDDDVATYTCGRSLVSSGRPAEAVTIFEALSVKFPDEPRPRGDMLDAKLDADLVAGDVEAAVSAAETALAEQSPAFHESAEGQHLRGRVAELSGDYEESLELFQEARGADPSHRRNLFHLAYLSERQGLEMLALDAYETLATMLPVDRSVMMNLGVLYEDLGRDQDAASCYDTIARTDPTDRFARLYLEDARAGMVMYYDEDLEKKEDRLNQILRIPITDFELSVRARNCLNKMDIMTLGDLVKKTESELLSYKNFGETSLTEIKEILASKGLRLGMAREEAVASIAKARTAQEGRDLDPNDPRNKGISELKLSIRARRTVENLGCLTLGDVTQHAEEELLGMPNFGVTSLLELRNRLAEYGLALKGDD
jgi:DNA-directed RNA polymerase subunit alpha